MVLGGLGEVDLAGALAVVVDRIQDGCCEAQVEVRVVLLEELVEFVAVEEPISVGIGFGEVFFKFTHKHEFITE